MVRTSRTGPAGTQGDRVSSLLAAARAVQENTAFADAAKAVLAACKAIVAADAGLVAVTAADGGLEIAVLDPGGLELDAMAGMPEPLRGLSARAAEGRTVFANDLAKGPNQTSQASVAVENAVLFEQMRAASERLRSLSHRLIEVQESERRNIARELHDEASQALASLRFGLRLLEREIDGGGNVARLVEELLKRTDTVIDGLYRLAANLRPASLDHLGLDAALKQYTESAASGTSLAVRFNARGFDGVRLPSTVETALFRVVQEAMNNVKRHADATHVDVLVEHRDDLVKVMIEDNGVGFEPKHVPSDARQHFGLLGMRERAEALGGSLIVESAPGSGTTIVVEVPRCPSVS